MDDPALHRQNWKIECRKEIDVERNSVGIYKEKQKVFDSLETCVAEQARVEAHNLKIAPSNNEQKLTNVAQVRQLSPFRYPGGKTWLVPEVRKWLITSKRTPSVFVEPFAGGAMAGLTVASERLAEQVVLSELDDDVAAVWQTIFSGTAEDVAWLCKKITTFEVNLENVRQVLDSNPPATKNRAWRTIIKNRMQRGGIMAAGAGLVKEGESGRGLRSRWYPDTLEERINALYSIRERVSFEHLDAFAVIRALADDENAFFFVDPPYTAGGKNAGKRLYTHNEIDHQGLFSLMASVKGSVMMTYADSKEVKFLAQRYNFRSETVRMKNTHHAIINELLILKP